MVDEPPPGPPPRLLGTPVRGFDRTLLAQIADRYGIEAVRRALDDYEAGKRARADG
jgi:hypothetical protein